MASCKPKKVVSQDQLRRLMKEKQCSVNPAAKKIDHPLAKYNSLNQLVCTLCNSVIKSENLWVAHIQSKQHKEKCEISKTQGPGKPPDVMAIKRKLAEIQEQPSNSKKIKDLNGSMAQIGTSVTALLPSYSSSSSDSSGADDDDDDDSKAGGNEKLPETSDNTTKINVSGVLPADFFDGPFKPEAEKEAEKPIAMSEVLPEGFFDDPRMDAKVRQVEYKDKMEEEWELFQRSMKEETHVSEAIIEEDNEQANIERNLDEIDDQIQRWKEVEDLHIKKETISKTSASDSNNKDSDELDEDDLSEFLDWRSKKSWK